MDFFDDQDDWDEPDRKKVESFEEYDTENLSRAIEHLGQIQNFAGSGFPPSQMREDLQRLHQMAEQIVDDGIEDDELNEEFWTLLDEVSSDALLVYESAQKLWSILSDLEDLQPLDEEWEDE